MKLNQDKENQSKQKIGRLALYLTPTLILILGSLLHYHRGYYGVDLAPIHARGVDDAYITFRYGWNLVHFNSLSWNESGYRQTEGFTNPLWVLGSAIWSIPGRKEWVYPLSVFSSVALSAILLITLTRLVFKNNEDSPASILGLILVAAFPAVWVNITSGLESGVFGIGLALLAYLVLTYKNNQYLSVYLIILTIFIGLLRSDAFIYLSIILIAALITGSDSWKHIAVGLAISTIILFSWRYISYGTFLPNTALAKLNFTLIERLISGNKFFLFVLINSGLLIMLLIGLGGLRVESRRVVLATIFIVVAWSLYYLYIGGDWGLERHLIGLYFLCAALSAPLWKEANHLTRVIYVVVILWAGVILIWRNGNRFDYSSPKSNDPWIMLGQALSEDRDSYGVIITGAAGKIPFFAGGDFIDLLGINDPYLATFERDNFNPGHSAGNDLAAYELARSHPSGIFSTFSFLDPQYIKAPEDISLWVDNNQPQYEVQHSVNHRQWTEAINSGDPFIWSIISKPVSFSGEES